MKSDFVTEGRLLLARNLAATFAERDPGASAAVCADKAVRRVFGRWIEESSGAIRPQHLPLHFRLVARVEAELGLHRRRRHDVGPTWPAARRVRASTTALAV